MADLNSLSNEELMSIAGIGQPQQQVDGLDLNSMSDQQLLSIAGIGGGAEPLGFFPSMLQGVKDTPRSIWETAKGAGRFVASPIDTVASDPVGAINTTGRLAAGGAGALLGAELGLLGGPLAPVTSTLGGILGGALGLLGYKKGLQEAPEIMSNMALEPGKYEAVIPPSEPGEDLSELGYNLGQGAAGTAIFKGLGKGAKALSGPLQESGKGFARKSVGATYQDYKNNPGAKAALDDLIESKVLGWSRNAEVMAGKVGAEVADLSDTVNTLIKDFDQNVGAPVYPQFNNALDYIAKGKVPANRVNTYVKRLTELDDGIKRLGNGRLEYLQQQKISVGKDFNPADSVDAGFARALYSDLRQAIEGAVPEVGPLNKVLQRYEIFDPILDRGLARAANSTAADSGLNMMKTTGGIGSALVAGQYGLGSPLLAGGAALGYLAGRTPTGQMLTGGALKGLGKAADAIGPRLSAAAPVLGAEFAAGIEPRTPELSFQQPTSRQAPSPGNYPSGTAQDRLSTEAQSVDPQASLSPSSYSNSVFDKDQSLSEPSVFAKLSKAVEKIESGGKADAVSNKGAVGTHQVRPIAMREVMRRQGIDDSALTDADLTAMAKRPGVSKRFGEAYLQMLVDQYDGDVELALAAYNAGPTLVDRLLKGDADTFADIRGKLPAETQAYVPRVRSVFEKI